MLLIFNFRSNVLNFFIAKTLQHGSKLIEIQPVSANQHQPESISTSRWICDGINYGAGKTV